MPDGWVDRGKLLADLDERLAAPPVNERATWGLRPDQRAGAEAAEAFAAAMQARPAGPTG